MKGSFNKILQFSDCTRYFLLYCIVQLVFLVPCFFTSFSHCPSLLPQHLVLYFIVQSVTIEAGHPFYHSKLSLLWCSLYSILKSEVQSGFYTMLQFNHSILLYTCIALVLSHRLFPCSFTQLMCNDQEQNSQQTNAGQNISSKLKDERKYISSHKGPQQKQTVCQCLYLTPGMTMMLV